jgi:N-acetylated-alpha-linked acidic dipeptidase
MRLADAEVLPFEFTNLTETRGTYVEEIEKLKPEGVDVASLRPVLAGMKKAAERLETARKKPGKVAPERLRELNLVLFRIERAMLDTGGLPGRPWFRHQFYAPGWYTGYDVKTLPGIREAVEHKQWDLARRQLEVVRKVFGLVTEQIGQATRLLE